MKTRHAAWAVAIFAAACGDLGAPRGSVRLAITPVFDSHAELAATADLLRIRLYRINPGPPRDSSLVKDTTVVVGADGIASADISVLLLQSPEFFRVQLDVMQTDGSVLFSGSQVVTVTSAAASAPQEVTLPVAWVGPMAARIVIAPKDTAIATGGSFTLRSIIFDGQDQDITSKASPRYYLVNPADASRLAVNRFSGLVTGLAGATGQVLVYAETTDPVPPRDTARIFLGSVPALVRLTPGIANVAVDATLALTGVVLDAFGNTVPGSAVSWISRTPGTATVNGSGLLTGAAIGTAVIVASSGALADSIRVTVPTATHLVMSTAPRGRSFGSPQVNDTLTVDVSADLRFTPSDKLGSYNARITWDPAKLSLEAVTAGDAGFSPTYNDQNKAAGQLTFADANAAGAAGTPVVARVRFKALAAGNAALALTLTEVSGSSPTFTNFFATNRVTVTNGNVTVRP